MSDEQIAYLLHVLHPRLSKEDVDLSHHQVIIYAQISNEREGDLMYGMLSKSGEELLKPVFSIRPVFRNGYNVAVAYKPDLEGGKGTWCIIDLQGNIVNIETSWDPYRKNSHELIFTRDMIVVPLENKMRVLDTSGNILLEKDGAPQVSINDTISPRGVSVMVDYTPESSNIDSGVSLDEWLQWYDEDMKPLSVNLASYEEE